MNKRTIVLTLLAIPFLMGNSPMPYPHEVEYSDFDYHLEVLSENDVANRYQLSVKNTGIFHLYTNGSLTYSGGNFFELKDESNTRIASSQLMPNNALFFNQTLGPGQTATYVLDNGSVKIDVNKVASIQAFCFNEIDAEVTYSEPVVKKLQSTSNYLYKVDTKIKNLHDYYYAIAVDVKYEDKVYSLIMRKNDLEFKSYQELDLSKFSIEKMTFYRSSYHTYKGNNGMIWMYILVIGGIFLIFILPILILVIAGIRKAIKKRKMKREL